MYLLLVDISWPYISLVITTPINNMDTEWTPIVIDLGPTLLEANKPCGPEYGHR